VPGAAHIQSPFSTPRLAGNCKSDASRSKVAPVYACARAGGRGGVPSVEDAVISFASTLRRRSGLARQLVLAVALAGGTAVLAVPGFVDAAHAQKKKKEGEAEAPKPSYSEAFVKAYQPLDAALKAPGADVAALKPQLTALVPLAVSPDEQIALGGLLFNAGITGKDSALQFQGVETMLKSGKVKPEELGKYNLIAFQLASQQNQFDTARAYLQKAIDLKYSSPTITTADLQLNMAEVFFGEERYAEGLKYLADAIAARKAAGQPVDPKWYRRGVSVAYTNEIVPQVYDFVQGWIIDNPTPENWRDAVNLTRNLNDYEGPVLLDLLRLGKRVGTLKDKNDFVFYIEAADTRRLPNEVKEVIAEANATGAIPKGSDTWVEEQAKMANSLIAEDRAGLPALERDANAATAQLRTVSAAGDAFLSYGQYDKAAAFYEKSLGMAGVDRNQALTRLGIAQVGLGNIAAARETFAKIEGVRAPIAMLWSAYAAQQGGSAVGG
jgi:tetratricopeptide (TPR) repeat protein